MRNDALRNTGLELETNDISEAFLARVLDSGTVACDVETSGLDWRLDRVGLIQLFTPGARPVLFRPSTGQIPSKLVSLLENTKVKKIFHHAMFDLRFLSHKWGVRAENIACTKIASKILNPESEKHSLSTLLSVHLDIRIEKGEQKSDWFASRLSHAQLEYAARDVIYLPLLLTTLRRSLSREGRVWLADHCFEHIPARVSLEVGGYGDVFAY